MSVDNVLDERHEVLGHQMGPRSLRDNRDELCRLVVAVVDQPPPGGAEVHQTDTASLLSTTGQVHRTLPVVRVPTGLEHNTGT